MIGRGSELVPRWRWFDLLTLGPAFSFSVSYGLLTDLKGFYHELPILLLDWGCPYLFTRALVRDRNSLRLTLRALAVSSLLLACLAVYECRMATRLAADLWNMLGIVLLDREHYGCWRWGFLRAFATFCGPISLGTFFVGVTPLMILWGLLDPRQRFWPRIATLACAAGVVTSLSRGPIVVLVAIVIVFVPLAFRPRALITILPVACIMAAPFLLDIAREEVQYTEQRLEATGNTADESGHYRVALLLIYGQRIVDVGWWGDRSIVGLDYKAADSIDNAYLYLFIVGGWIGGGAFCLIVVMLLYWGVRSILYATGHDRKILVATVASFAGVAGCMANVWFASDYAPFFWTAAALVCNVSGVPSRIEKQGHLMPYRLPQCLVGPPRARLCCSSLESHTSTT
jgi:hypothetical protein